MVLTGLWVSKYRYKVMDVESGQSEITIIMGSDDEMDDPVLMQELQHKQRERVEEGWEKEKPTPHTPDQRRDLGQILKQIGESRDYYRENLHSRYWLGSEV